jgi:hypothetical protein
MADAPNPKGFFENINSSEAGQLLGLTANSLQVIGFFEPIIAGLLTESDTDKLLDAINKLQQTLDNDFAALGDLIKKQIQMLAQNEDTLALAGALAHSRTGSDKFSRFLRTKATVDLNDADTQSDLGIQFFLNLPDPQPGPTLVASRIDPFFLPAAVKAATIRIMVIILQDPGFRSIPDDVDQINNIISLIQGMVDNVKATVNAAHTVQLKAHELHTSRGSSNPVIIFDGYYHVERGHLLQFFSAGGARNEDDPRVVKAQKQAEAARNAGVAAELAFLGITQIDRLLAQWRQILVHPATSVRGVRTAGDKLA